MPRRVPHNQAGLPGRCWAAWGLVMLLLVVTPGSAAAAQDATVSQALALIHAGRFTAAHELLEPYVKRHPKELGAQYWLGRAYLGEGNTSAAIEVFEQVLQAKPGSVDSRLWLAAALAEDGQRDAARRELDKVLPKRPNDPVARALSAELRQPPTVEIRPVTADFEQLVSDQKGRVVLVTGGLDVEPGSVDILSSNLYDYTFGNAPVDWAVTNGIWESTYRWACQPQWSWYGGCNATGPAAVWNKREFVGDILVEVYAAFKHKFDITTRAYKNPHDINITICGNGRDFDSGYTFMLGGKHNTVTQITKGTRVLASTTAPEMLLPIFEEGFPTGYEFHRKWWGLRVSKVGSKLRFFVDDQLACEADDPSPLPGGKVALWTYDNGILIPRVKIYYEAELAGTSPPVQPASALPAPAAVAAEVLVSSSSHPSIQNDFENGLGKWSGGGDDGAAQLAVVSRGAGDGGHCLKLTNARTGGTFAGMIQRESFDVGEVALMSFDYRVSGDVAVNFYLTVEEQLFEIVFTGPASGSPQSWILGQISGVRADGKWHHAEFDLLGHLQEALGQTDKIRASKLFIGNLSEEDYLGAGFGRNHAGAHYYLDNFALLTPSANSTVSLSIKPGPASRSDQHVVTLDDSPTPGQPSQAVAIRNGTAQIEAPRTGTWYAHVYPKLANNKWGTAANYQVRIDQQAPRLSAEPADGQQLPDGPVTVLVDDPGGAGLDAAALVVEMNGHRYKVNDPAVDFDLVTNRLSLDPRLAGITASAGESVAITLKQVRDRAGNELGKPLHLAYQFDPAGDKLPPLVRVEGLGGGPVLDEDFEAGVGEISPYGGAKSALVLRDASTAASGKYSLKVTNATEGGSFGIYLRKWPFDAGRCRLLAFDYKIPPRLRVDLAMEIGGAWQCIKFTDTTNDLDTVGTVPNVRADNKWHHAEIDLYQLLRRANPLRRSYRVGRLVLADFGWRGNYEGQSYHLDNVQLIPVTGGGSPLKLVWEAFDLSGIAGVSWLLTGDAHAQPPTQVAATASPAPLVSDGEHDGWLHLRACDQAGNWSETVHRRVMLDDKPPVMGGVQPPAGAEAAPNQVELVLYDEGLSGIDPSSIRLKVDGQMYDTAKGALVYNAKTSRLTWNCQRVKPEPVVFADRQQVEVSLEEAVDFAGNKLTEPLRWAWRMDYSRDSEPPLIVGLHSRSHPTVACYTFEDGLGSVRTAAGVTAASVDDSTAATGAASLKLTKLRGGRLEATIHTEPFDASKFPLVAFDYKIPPEVKVGLALRVDKQWLGYDITTPVERRVGKVPDIKADDQWHHAAVRLSIPQRRGQRKGQLIVQEIKLTDISTSTNSTGATMHLDNFFVGNWGSGPGKVEWWAGDATGIAGYSWLLDETPNAVPPETIKTHEPKVGPSKLESGLWFVHVRARDGAGNWGPAAHYALLNQ